MYTVRNYLGVSEYCKLSNLYTSTQIYVIFTLKHKFKVNIANYPILHNARSPLTEKYQIEKSSLIMQASIFNKGV